MKNTLVLKKNSYWLFEAVFILIKNWKHEKYYEQAFRTRFCRSLISYDTMKNFARSGNVVHYPSYSNTKLYMSRWTALLKLRIKRNFCKVFSSILVRVSLVTIGQVVCQIFPDIAHPLLLLFCSVSWLEVDQLDQGAPDVHAEPWHRWQLLWSILDVGHLVSVQLGWGHVC